jgi:hypothetical protein
VAVGADAADDVVRDAVALVLAVLHVGDELGVLGVLRQQVAQQHGYAFDVLAGAPQQHRHLGVLGGSAAKQEHRLAA